MLTWACLTLLTVICSYLGLNDIVNNDALTWARILIVGRIFIHQGISPTCILAKDDDWVKLKAMSKQHNINNSKKAPVFKISNLCKLLNRLVGESTQPHTKHHTALLLLCMHCTSKRNHRTNALYLSKRNYKTNMRT